MAHRILLLTAFALLFARISVAQGVPGTDVNSCLSGKTSCIKTYASGLLKCREKCQKKPSSCGQVQSDCEAKVVARFNGSPSPARGCFARLEARSNPEIPESVCTTVGDAAEMASQANACVIGLLGSLERVPTPIGQAFPATGQTTCWDSAGTSISCTGTGQDGEIRAGGTLAYQDNGDGTVTDVNTGLTWEQLDDNNTGGIHDQHDQYNWTQAFTKIEALNTPPCFANHCDWRLPNYKELISLVNLQAGAYASISSTFRAGCAPGCTIPACSCTPTFGSGFWTSSTAPAEPAVALEVWFGNGLASGQYKGEQLTVRAVRGASGTLPRTGQTLCWDSVGGVISCAGTGQDGELQAGVAQGYNDNGDGTITDTSTLLTWEKLDDNDTGGIHDHNNGYYWMDASTVKIAALNSPPCFAGHCDWRLPNYKELMSILDLSDPAGAPSAFRVSCAPGCTAATCSCPGGFNLPFWSSSTAASFPSNAWVRLPGLNLDPQPKQYFNYLFGARAVRGGL